jgi:hypothetical protein
MGEQERGVGMPPKGYGLVFAAIRDAGSRILFDKDPPSLMALAFAIGRHDH